MALPKPPRRHRSSSDPFSDPPSISYSSYGVPTLARNAPPAPANSRAPPVPPKIPAAAASSRNRQPGMSSEISTVPREQTTRTRVGRSQTQLPAANPTRPTTAPTTTRRSLSQDSVPRVANSTEKAKSSSRRTPKKGSSHADVIDRLDFSGVGPMFHHDGPFDACAPSRNRHKTRAPMMAWTGPAEEDREALANAREIPSSMSPYPSPGVYAPYEAPKKKYDAIAEAWGIHEPEPFEDFSAGGGFAGGQHSEFNTPTTRNGNHSSRRTKDGREARDRYKDYLEDSQPQVRRQPTKRAPIPPPQPIFVPEADGDVPSGLPPSPTGAPSSPGAPKRTKSLMHRIRKMRDAPNVPPQYDEQVNGSERDGSPPSPTENSHSSNPARPTHRSQNSFLGKFAGAPRAPKDLPSPSDEAYVYVEDPATGRREKSLPRPPTSPKDGPDGYFDGGYASAGGGLNRKTSLLKKIRGVAKGGGAPNK